MIPDRAERLDLLCRFSDPAQDDRCSFADRHMRMTEETVI